MPSDSAIADPRRRPKGDKRARTREALLDAAGEVTREKGFDQTTLQDVAHRAGMTTGAIYGNFRNRDDLFMALAERQWSTIRPRFAPGSSFATKMRALSEAVLASIPERQPAAIGALRFRAYALGHEEVRVQFRDAMAAGYDAGAAFFRAAVAEDDLPMPPEVLVRVINALIEGLSFQRFLTPELMPDEAFHQAFAALAGGPQAPAKETSGGRRLA
jgi:AcrR family transcriptional regulator